MSLACQAHQSLTCTSHTHWLFLLQPAWPLQGDLYPEAPIPVCCYSCCCWCPCLSQAHSPCEGDVLEAAPNVRQARLGSCGNAMELYSCRATFLQPSCLDLLPNAQRLLRSTAEQCVVAHLAGSAGVGMCACLLIWAACNG